MKKGLLILAAVSLRSGACEIRSSSFQEPKQDSTSAELEGAVFVPNTAEQAAQKGASISKVTKLQVDQQTYHRVPIENYGNEQCLFPAFPVDPEID